VPTREGDFDTFKDWLEHLGNASEQGHVLVRHKSAADELTDMGIKNVLWVEEATDDLVEDLAKEGKPCILLYDFDDASNKKAAEIKTKLEQNGITVNTGFRKFLFAQNIREVAGLRKHFHRVAGSERRHESLDL